MGTSKIRLKPPPLKEGKWYYVVITGTKNTTDYVGWWQSNKPKDMNSVLSICIFDGFGVGEWTRKKYSPCMIKLNLNHSVFAYWVEGDEIKFKYVGEIDEYK
jgi:hypothetical protein